MYTYFLLNIPYISDFNFEQSYMNFHAMYFTTTRHAFTPGV